MKSIVVLYHAQCRDGFSAAWSAWKKLKNKADYFPVEHQVDPPVLKNKTIYMLDFCYPKELMEKIVKENKRVIVIDHHAMMQKDALCASEFVFDNNHSGAVLAWRYFHPKKKIPTLLKYVEDIDLWKFKQPHSKEITLAIDLFPYTFKNWDKISKDLEKKGKAFKNYLIKGSAIAAYTKIIIKEMADLADKVNFEGYQVLAANCPRFLKSALGNELAKRCSSFGIAWHLSGKKIHVSLRAQGKVDVAKIAQKYGGGGHKNASGFVFDFDGINAFPWKIIEKKNDKR